MKPNQRKDKLFVKNTTYSLMHHLCFCQISFSTLNRQKLKQYKHLYCKSHKFYIKYFIKQPTFYDSLMTYQNTMTDTDNHNIS